MIEKSPTKKPVIDEPEEKATEEGRGDGDILFSKKNFLNIDWSLSLIYFFPCKLVSSVPHISIAVRWIYIKKDWFCKGSY